MFLNSSKAGCLLNAIKLAMEHTPLVNDSQLLIRLPLLSTDAGPRHHTVAACGVQQKSSS